MAGEYVGGRQSARPTRRRSRPRPRPPPRRTRDRVPQGAGQLGVKIAFGTDSAVSPHGLNAEEFGLLVDHGMTPAAALRAATSAAATLLGLDEQTSARSRPARRRTSSPCPATRWPTSTSPRRCLRDEGRDGLPQRHGRRSARPASPPVRGSRPRSRSQATMSVTAGLRAELAQQRDHLAAVVGRVVGHVLDELPERAPRRPGPARVL